MLSKDLVVADRFRLIKMIGKGGMGSVWEAKHLGLDTPCALKFIEGELANLQEAHARFEREAKAAAQLRSQHIVQVFDHGVWQGTPYIAMELLNGMDLGHRITERGGVLPPKELLAIVSQVCRALKKAHQGGFVHRDLKPDNIYLCKEDDGAELVKILDFGVAKQTGQAIDGSNTKTGAMLGTPYYMSPEQAQGIKEVRGTSDLWALAVIVYQCLTGRLPFESEALGDLLFKIFTHEAVPPSQINAALPPALDDWWKKAAAKAPEQRWQTADDFRDSLQSVFGDITHMERIGERTAALRQLGGGTAVMANNIPNTPNPYSQQTAAMSTPNPYQKHTQAIPTPQSLGQSPLQPQMMQHPGMAQSQPGTFSGAEAPAIVPKKGVPLALVGGFLALLVLGGVFGGYAIVKRRGDSVAAAGSASASAVASVVIPETTPSASASSAPPASVAGNDPPPPSTAGDPPPATTTSKPPGGAQLGHHPPPVVPPKPPVTPPPTTAATTKPTGTTPAVKPTSTLGF